MWETPFEASMIGSNIIIHCPDGDLVSEFFEILKSNGVSWLGGESLNRTYWDECGESTCYRIMSDKTMRRGDVECYQDARYDNYTKCTFCGVDTPNFDPATDDELIAFLGIGGAQ